MIQMSRERFEELVSEALDRVPPELARLIDNCVVLVEDRPPPEDPDLLGVYEGYALTDRGSEYSGVLPDRITIFRGPLCERARDEDDLAEQVRVTVLHEVGHHFGIADERLRELGWA